MLLVPLNIKNLRSALKASYLHQQKTKQKQAEAQQHLFSLLSVFIVIKLLTYSEKNR